MHRKRPVFFEGLVFGLAAVLALVIAVAGLSRLLNSRKSASSPRYATGEARGGYGQDALVGGNLRFSGTEASVSAAAPASATYGAPERTPAPVVPGPSQP